jgi:hypothetical protein
MEVSLATAGDPWMTKRRLSFVNALIASIIGLSLLAILLRKEMWPFSPYAMYSDRALPGTIAVYRLYGMAETGGEEFPLTEYGQLKPLGALTVDAAFRKLHQKGPSALIREGVLDCCQRYESLRQGGEHSGPPLKAIRLYRIGLDTDGRQNPGRPCQEKELLMEVHKE